MSGYECDDCGRDDHLSISAMMNCPCWNRGESDASSAHRSDARVLAYSQENANDTGTASPPVSATSSVNPVTRVSVSTL